MLGLDAGVSPILNSRPIIRGELGSSQAIANSVLITPELKLGWTFARNGVLGFSVRQTTGYGHRRLNFYVPNYNFYNHIDNQPYHFRVRSYCLSYQNFMFKSAGKLAPNGFYFKAMGGLWIAKGSADSTYTDDPVEFEKASRTLLFSPGLGYNFLVTDFLIFDLGFEGIVTLPVIKGSQELSREIEFVTQNQAIRLHLGLHFLFGGGKWR
jgi:hypothetical protein